VTSGLALLKLPAARSWALALAGGGEEQAPVVLAQPFFEDQRDAAGEVDDALLEVTLSRLAPQVLDGVEEEIEPVLDQREVERRGRADADSHELTVAATPANGPPRLPRLDPDRQPATA
jgi:hypothetical protein